MATTYFEFGEPLLWDLSLGLSIMGSQGWGLIILASLEDHDTRYIAESKMLEGGDLEVWWEIPGCPLLCMKPWHSNRKGAWMKEKKRRKGSQMDLPVTPCYLIKQCAWKGQVCSCALGGHNYIKLAHGRPISDSPSQHVLHPK